MASTKIYPDVPNNQVPGMVDQFLKDDATSIHVSNNGNGTSDVTVTFDE